ncbi:MAG: hypothetical protein ACLSUW_05615 [Akkermansia sp.]
MPFRRQLRGAYLLYEKTLSSPRPERCTDWTTPVGEDPWDARKYATDDECKRWLGMVYDRARSYRRGNLRMAENLPSGLPPCDNDQPTIRFLSCALRGGLTGTFTMTAFEQGRHIEVYGTKGKIRAGVFYKENGPGEITVTPHFGGKPWWSWRNWPEATRGTAAATGID